MSTLGRTVSFKLVLLGDAAVGKSSSVDRFVRNEFSDFQQPTIGAAFLTQIVNLEDRIVKFEIWDTAGQERYRSLAPMYYRGAGAALVVYDITDPDSFHGARTWIEELHRQGNPEIIIALAGNKADLEDKRKVSKEEAQHYADEQQCLFFETSAKTGQNIHEVFRAIAERLPREVIPIDHEDTVEILGDQPTGGCCR